MKKLISLPTRRTRRRFEDEPRVLPTAICGGMESYVGELPAPTNRESLDFLRRYGLGRTTSGSPLKILHPTDEGTAAPPEVTHTNLRKQWGRPVGFFSEVDKMPGLAFSLPAGTIKTGGTCIVASFEVDDSVCDGCYALQGRYLEPVAQRAQWQRKAYVERLLAAVGPQEAALVFAAALRWNEHRARRTDRARRAARFFRLHDSGAIYSPAYAEMWRNVACLLWLSGSKIRIWVPLRIWAVALQAARGDMDKARRHPLLRPMIEMSQLPNAVVRPSALSFHAPGRPPGVPTIEGLARASGTWFELGEDPEGAVPEPGMQVCVAPEQGGMCWGDVECSHCWEDAVVILYRQHGITQLTPKLRRAMEAARKLIQVPNKPGGRLNREVGWLVVDPRTTSVFTRLYPERDHAAAWARANNMVIASAGSGRIYTPDGVCMGQLIAT